MDPDTVERVARDTSPQDLFPAVEAELGAIAALRRVQPDQDLELEHQLLRIPARLGKEAAPATQRHVVGAPLQQVRFEVPREPLAQGRQVFAHELLLERVGVGRDQYTLAVANRAGDRGHQVGKALACARTRLHHEGPAPRLDLRHGDQHLHLRLAVLVAGQHVGERPVRSKQGGDGVGVVGRRFPGPSAAGRLDTHRGLGLRAKVGRAQSVGEKARHGPRIGRDQGKHRLFQSLVQGPSFVAQAQQELTRCVGVVEGSVRPGLAEPHLGREQGQAVASSGGQQDPSDVQGVEDLLVGAP